MEKNDKTIIIHEGIGDDAIEITVQVSQKEFDKMEQIRKFSPENWEGKDLELLQEARKIISEEPDATPMAQSEVSETHTIETKKKEPKHNNSGLWWTLGLLAAVFIAYQGFMYYVKQQTKGLHKYVQSSALSNIKKTMDFEGVTFDYPGNWSFVKNKISDEVCMIEGNNEIGAEYVIMIFKSTAFMPVEDCIDAVVTGFTELDEGNGIEYSAIYNAQFNGMGVLASDCNYKYKGNPCYAQVKGFELYGNNITIISTARDNSALSGDDFKMMENSFKYLKTY